MNAPPALFAITVVGGLLGVSLTSARHPSLLRLSSTATATQIVEVRPAHCFPRDPPTGHFGYYGFRGYTFDLNGFDLQFETWNPAAGTWQGRYTTDPPTPRDVNGEVYWSGAAVDMICFQAYVVYLGWYQNQLVVMDFGDVYPIPTDPTCGGGGGGGDDGWMDQAPSYRPVSAPLADASCGGGGGDSGGGGGGDSGCTVQWGTIEISYDGGATWEVWWEGYYTECES